MQRGSSGCRPELGRQSSLCYDTGMDEPQRKAGKFPSQHVFWVAACLAVLIAGALGWLVFRSYRIREFPDTHEYVRVAQAPLFSKQFLAGQRPLTTPLLLKMVRSDYERFALLQFVLWITSWGALAAVVGWMLRSWIAKTLGLIGVLSLALTSDIFLWNGTVLSETSSNALFALLVATGLLLVHSRQWFRRSVQAWAAIGVGALLGFWSMTRDANMFGVLAVAAMALLALLWSFFRTHFSQWRWFLGALVVFGILIFSAQNFVAERAGRWKIPLIDVIGKRVLVDAEATSYFVQRGMPLNERVTCFTGLWATDCGYDWSGFGDWLQRGKTVYYHYLLTHLVFTLTQQFVHWNEFYNGDNTHYFPVENPAALTTSPPPIPGWQVLFTATLYPKGAIATPLLIVAALISVIAVTLRRADRRWVVPIALLILILPLSLVVWHGDSRELERHGLLVAVQGRLAVLLVLLLTADMLLERKRLHPSETTSEPSSR